jgi:hypothetical protein
VTSMRQMFSQANSFTASDLADWERGQGHGHVRHVSGHMEW